MSFTYNTHDREINVSGSDLRPNLVDVFDPLGVRIESVRRDANNFHAAGLEVLLSAGNLTKLGSAHLIDRYALDLITELYDLILLK